MTIRVMNNFLTRTPDSRCPGRCCARFDLGQPGSSMSLCLDLLVQVIEVEHVDLRSAHGVLDHGAGLHDEGPVAGLGQQQLAGRLVERAALQAVRPCGWCLGQLDHAVRRLVQVAVDPVVGAFQPDLAVALVAPARQGRLRRPGSSGARSRYSGGP